MSSGFGTLFIQNLTLNCLSTVFFLGGGGEIEGVVQQCSHISGVIIWHESHVEETSIVFLAGIA